VSEPILSEARAALVERAAALGPGFRGRAAGYDRDARFPHENWAELAEAGLLGLCVPEAAGGLGGDFVSYALVGEELGRHCLSTALTFNMHVATTLLAGQIADDMTLDPAELAHLHVNRSVLWDGIVQQGRIHAQPFSEGMAAGATAGYATEAVPVEGGFAVSGRKIFASLSGAADFHNVVCRVPGDPRLRLMGIPADAAGLAIEGDWDPLGARATDSRNLVMTEAFVPAVNEWIPAGMFDQAAERWPHFYMTLSLPYLGLMRAIMDDTAEYLIGDGSPGGRREQPVKQQGWAEMNLAYEAAQALCYRVLGEVGVDPSAAAVRRAWASMVTVMEGAPRLASLALRVCGGRALLRPSALERHYRDARCGAVMLPWSVEACLARLGRSGLFEDADEAPA